MSEKKSKLVTRVEIFLLGGLNKNDIFRASFKLRHLSCCTFKLKVLSLSLKFIEPIGLKEDVKISTREQFVRNSGNFRRAPAVNTQKKLIYYKNSPKCQRDQESSVQFLVATRNFITNYYFKVQMGFEGDFFLH